jgi:hypothetical protein
MVDSLPRWRDKRFLVMLALGFAAGVPLPLSAFTLRQWLSESNLSFPSALTEPTSDHRPQEPLDQCLMTSFAL